MKVNIGWLINQSPETELDIPPSHWLVSQPIRGLSTRTKSIHSHFSKSANTFNITIFFFY